MELSLVEIKEKLKPQLKSLLDVDTFKIVAAERKEKFWVLVIQYQEFQNGPGGVARFLQTKTTALNVEPDTGKIEAMIQ